MDINFREGQLWWSWNQGFCVLEPSCYDKIAMGYGVQEGEAMGAVDSCIFYEK